MDADSASLMDIFLDDPGERSIGISRVVHRLTDLNAKQAKKLVDSAPQTILRRMTRTFFAEGCIALVGRLTRMACPFLRHTEVALRAAGAGVHAKR